MSAESIYAVAEEKMTKSLEALQVNLSKIRTGRVPRVGRAKKSRKWPGTFPVYLP